MKKDSAYLHHISDAISAIEEYTRDITREEFFEKRIIQDAVIREFEIIGEATKNLSEEIRRKYSDIPWNKVAGMRDKLIHGYFGVNLNLVWVTIHNQLPVLKDNISKILKQISMETKNTLEIRKTEKQ